MHALQRFPVSGMKDKIFTETAVWPSRAKEKIKSVSSSKALSRFSSYRLFNLLQSRHNMYENGVHVVN